MCVGLRGGTPRSRNGYKEKPHKIKTYGRRTVRLPHGHRIRNAPPTANSLVVAASIDVDHDGFADHHTVAVDVLDFGVLEGNVLYSATT